MQPTIKNAQGPKFQVADHSVLICGFYPGAGDEPKLIPFQVGATGALTVQGLDANGNPVALGPAVVTPHFLAMGASASQDIPIGAKGYLISIRAGTGTIGGQAVAAVTNVNSSNTLAVAITVTTGAASSAFVIWEI